MSDEQESKVAAPPAEERSRVLTLALQLVVIPLAVVAFCVALGAMFMWLTSERKDFKDYLSSLRSSTGPKRGDQARYLLNYIQESKRWQGIFDVSARISGDRDRFLMENPQAVAELVQVFEESRDRDPKTRRYVALVLGSLGGVEAAPVLQRGLDDSDPETVKNCIWALGRLQADGAAGKIIELTQHAEVSVRLMAVYVLGGLTHPQARDLLVASLNDPNEMVQWNAAFGLASRGDDAGEKVLERLLDKQYVDRFTDVTLENRQRYRVAAVEWLGKLKGEQAAPLLEPVSANDLDLRVRNAALQQLNQWKQK